MAAVQADNINLPALDDNVSGVVTPQQEQALGQAFLRLFHSQVKEYDDPLMEDYLQNLLARIAQYSKLEDKHLDLILINNPQINAFAAPGGIVGVHSGLFLNTRSESELAGVLSHELAHLSQRHFARNVERSRQATLPTIAGLLAGMVLLATTHSDAGMAAIASTQAAGLETALRFSRENEQEADNIGMQTLYDAGFDPAAMTSMFERLLDTTRLMGQRAPEFLLDHPITQQRIAESRARTNNLPSRHVEDNLSFQLICARVRLNYAENPQQAIKRFQGELEGKSPNTVASQYGLALALAKAQRVDEAEAQIRKLLAQYPQQPEFSLALADILLLRDNTRAAATLVNDLLQVRPHYYPARLMQAQIFNRDRKYTDAERVLTQLTIERPLDTRAWYELAEARGLSGNTGGVFLARAEYYLLNGFYDPARQQLNYAQKFYKDDHIQTERIKHRLIDLDAMQKMSLKI